MRESVLIKKSMKKLLIILSFLNATIAFSQSNIIGNPYVLGKIKVAEFDCPKIMSWDEAVIECSKLGEGWRLPTREELNEMYKNKSKIKNFNFINYWSSVETPDKKYAYILDFGSGNPQAFSKKSTYKIRAVKNN
jgi:hypothetical protein